MSSNTGYKTGGQNLTVQGYGFNGDISATLDGVACTITRSSDFSFSCTVETKAEVSTSLSDPNATFVGSNGLRRITYNHTSYMDLDNLIAYNQSQYLALSLETFYEYKPRYWDVYSSWTSYPRAYVVNEFKGWFIPPATTRYKFYQYCDDWCKVSFSNVIGDSTENVTDLVSQSG